MKKLLALLIALTMMFVLASCDIDDIIGIVTDRGGEDGTTDGENPGTDDGADTEPESPKDDESGNDSDPENPGEDGNDEDIAPGYSKGLVYA